MAFVIALTGGIGSGKSSVSSTLAQLGAAVIDTDEIARRLTAAGQPGALMIAQQFGAQYLLPDGALDRARMRELIFSDASAKKKLEAILHPMIRAEVRTGIQNARAPYVVIVVPLLLETDAYRDIVQRILVVDCDQNLRIARVMQRSGLSEDAVRAIMSTQVSREQRLARADDVIRNESDLTSLHAATEALHLKYLALAREAESASSRSDIKKIQ